MDLIKALGPFGKRFEHLVQPPAQTEKASLKEEPERSLQTTRQSPARKNRENFHKKSNITYLRDQDGRVADRLYEIEKRQKNKRTEVIMENRKPNSSFLSTCQSIKGKQLTESGPLDKTKVESRKEQLARWKKEKDELARQNAGGKKPPFKAGAGGPVHGVPPSRPGSAVVNRPNQRQILAPGQQPKAQPESLPTERRVTRAMTAKAGVPVSKSASSSKTNLNVNTVTVTNRLKNFNVSKTAPVVAPVVSISSLLPVNNKAANGPSKKMTSTNGVTYRGKDSPINTEQPDIPSSEDKVDSVDMAEPAQSNLPLNNLPPVPAAQTPVKKKKAKGMQFDAVYIEYNDVFVKACRTLMEYSTQWNKILAERTDIPEETYGDIQSTLGQAQLLMESKMPQFGEILYFYLSRHSDPGPILPCDLQGWWDVAVISIDKVKARFDNLLLLANNNWIEAKPKPVLLKRANTVPIALKTKTSDEKKAQASAGLRAFLANKRKGANDVEDVPEEKVEKVTVSESIEFEGGFFSISSPARRTPSGSTTALIRVTGSHALHSDPRLTPARRQSSSISNTSLRMLAVRKSMNSICKLGVTPGKENDGKIRPTGTAIV